MAANPIPFDLAKAKAGHPLVTRDGRPAKFIAHVPEAKEIDSRLIVLIEGGVYLHCDDGCSIPDPDRNARERLDLFLAPKPKRKLTLWVNAYYRLDAYGSPDRQHLLSLSYGFHSEAEADRMCSEPARRIGGHAWPLVIEVDYE